MFFFSSFSGVFTCGNVFEWGELLWLGGSGAGIFFLREIGRGLSAFAKLKNRLLHSKLVYHVLIRQILLVICIVAGCRVPNFN
jgi:hypothetical protein